MAIRRTQDDEQTTEEGADEIDIEETDNHVPYNLMGSVSSQHDQQK
jgi:hypothetical protein